MKFPQVPTPVRKLLAAEGISDAELGYMLDHSAITSVEGCNRRFHHWLFEVRNDVLLRMFHAAIVEHGKNRGHGFMVEECTECEGDGCKVCGWRGEVHRWLGRY